MKKKNKGRKSLTAVGAVVAAGLTPGIATGTPASQPPITDVEITAADVVSINGETFDFDELFAMHQVNRDPQTQKLVYGPPPPRAQNEEEQQARIREEMRRDSIRRAEANQERVYGPPSVMGRYSPETLREMAANNKSQATSYIRDQLTLLVADLTGVKRINISPDSNLFTELNLAPERLNDLSKEIERKYGVIVTDEMLQQLNSVRRLTDFIVEVIKPIKN